MVWSVRSDYFMAGYSSKVHSDGKAWYHFHRYPPPPASLFLSLSLSCTCAHAPHARSKSPSGCFCMNYRLLMWGYEMPSVQEAVQSLAVSFYILNNNNNEHNQLVCQKYAPRYLSKIAHARGAMYRLGLFNLYLTGVATHSPILQHQWQ